MSLPDPLNEEEKPQGQPMGGSFECQNCRETIREARLLPNGNLEWDCECGHTSVIKEFMR